MEALSYIDDMLSTPSLIKFVDENAQDTSPHLVSLNKNIRALRTFMMSRKFRVLISDRKKPLIGMVQQVDHILGLFMSKFSSSGTHNLVVEWRRTIESINHTMISIKYCKLSEDPYELGDTELEDLFRCMPRIDIENMLLQTADSSSSMALDEKQSRALFFKKAFPAFGELSDHVKIENFYYESFFELDSLPNQICMAYEGESLALLLIGGLLSFKPIAYDTWNRVKDDLLKMKKCHIITYCYDHLPYFLQQCFLYLACYPIGCEIPVTSLTEKWIAEGFVTPGDGETTEEIANKYLDQLIQRSLVCVSKRSIFGTIKSCRVNPSIHEFVIKKSHENLVWVVNPDQDLFQSQYTAPFRIAIHPDNKKQYTEVKNNRMRSFLAFNYDGVFFGSAVSFLRVLELRKSTIPVTTLSNMINLRYMGLRGSNISKLPENIGDMKKLETIDIRDTNIETLPESLWNISTLRHVYVQPSPQIKGPPSAAKIPDIQILKTIAAHESWAQNIPLFLIHLRKLALSNCDNLDWKSISNLLSHMDKLISVAIMSNIIPSESVDLRAFPNLETVKSIKLEGQWNCRKLFIDNVKFPPNLAKLTLTNSGLKEDPMPTLERLQALKFLSLQDEAYTGEQMVCTSKGFQKLQFLKLRKLQNLKNWEVKEGAMPQLTTLRVVQCGKLNHPSNLPVTITEIDD